MENFTEFEDLRRLYRRISSRIKNVEKLDLINTGYSAVRDFKKLYQTYGSPKKSMDDKTLRSMYRDLKYIDRLKTSTVKGAKIAHENFKEIEGELGSFSPNTREKFWSVYNKLYERTGSLIEYFKYDAFSNILNEMYSGANIDDIVDDLYKRYLTDIERLEIDGHDIKKYKEKDTQNGFRVPYT